MIEKNDCTIVFTGDIGFDRYMENQFLNDNLLSDTIVSFCQNSDHLVANVEGALYKGKDNGKRGIFFHTMNPLAVRVLDQIHCDIYNISNNHIMDGQLEGLESTLKIANEKSIKTIGAGINEREASKPVYLNEAGGIGIFGVAYMNECIPATEATAGIFRWDNMSLIQKRIEQIKENNRWCIIVAHGGEEFADLPNFYTRNRYIEYLNMGADIVVGHHPHVVENYEIFDNKAIFYSLGNFIFDTDYQRAHPYTDQGILLKLHLSKEGFTFEHLATRIDRQSETIKDSTTPAIFCDINSIEYELLSYLSARAFIEEEKKKMIYLEPETYKNADEEKWNSYFYSDQPDGYAKGSHMDLAEILNYINKEEPDKYNQSNLKEVMDYLLYHFK